MRRFFNVFIMILNLSLMVGKLYLFNYLGWITLHPAAPIHTLQDSLLTAVAIALVFFSMVYVISDFFMGLASWLSLFVTIGVGYIALRMVAAIVPAFLSVTGNLWIGCLAGCILLYLWIPDLPNDKTSPEDSSTGEIDQHTKPVEESGSVDMLQYTSKSGHSFRIGVRLSQRASSRAGKRAKGSLRREARHFLNAFIIMMGKLYLLNYIGWIILHPAVQIHTLQDSLLTTAAIALVFILISYVVWFVYSIFFLATLALGCLLYPFVILGTGYVTLHMIAAIAPAFLGVTDNFWTGCLAGCILMRIPNLSDDKASPVDSSTDEIGQHTKPVEESGSVDKLPQELANEQKAATGENDEKDTHERELGDEHQYGPS